MEKINNNQKFQITDLDYASDLSNDQAVTSQQVQGGILSMNGYYASQDVAQAKQVFFQGLGVGIYLLPRLPIPTIYTPDLNNPALNPNGQNEYGSYALTATGANQTSISYQSSR